MNKAKDDSSSDKAYFDLTDSEKFFYSAYFNETDKFSQPLEPEKDVFKECLEKVKEEKAKTFVEQVTIRKRRCVLL